MLSSMPLMGKKAPSPQELYRSKKQKEEEEKEAFLPPGLVNHGNTCFMNSVLQGLIATPMLVDIIQFSLPDSYLPISSPRSPQLTNGHGRGGELEKEWENGMPLGDVFVKLMEKAWKLQDERMRSSMSPKEILSKLGAKYDQYLDFRQQDAHELLRHLLDAMRMEELDIIKKRQPPPPKAKRKRIIKGEDLSSSIASLTSQPLPLPPIPEEDRLTSFVDMVFGGQLASILICENCKKISCTYEDFNDLSLSIKPEDYEKARTKDRLRNLAKRFRVKGLDLSSELNLNLHSGVKEDEEPVKGEGEDQPRSSSVPASPTRHSADVERSFETVMSEAETRRRSLDAGDEVATLTTARLARSVTIVEPEDDFLESKRKENKETEEKLKGKGKEKGKEKEREKDDDSDGWVKLSRRISVGMGLKKGRRKGHGMKEAALLERSSEHTASASEDSVLASVPSPQQSPDPSIQSPSPNLLSVPDAEEHQQGPRPSTPTSGASATTAPTGMAKFGFSRRPSPSRTPTRASSPLVPTTPSLSPAASPSIVPSITSLPALPTIPLLDRRTTSPFRSRATKQKPNEKEKEKEKTKAKQKPSRKETEYLRRLLADIPSPSTMPFMMLRSPHTGTSTTGDSPSGLGLGLSGLQLGRAAGSGGLWSKFGNVQSVEECLRMFTAVEVLDGENQVGCRRCWKIENGEYVPRGRGKRRERSGYGDGEGKSSESASDSDSESDDENEGNGYEDMKVDANVSGVTDQETKASAVSPTTTPPSSNSPNTSSLDLALNEDGSDSVRSVPTGGVEEHVRPDNSSVPSIPSISMTAPENEDIYETKELPPVPTTPTTPESTSFVHQEDENLVTTPTPRRTMALQDNAYALRPASPLHDSLQLPAPSFHVRHPAHHGSNHSRDGEAEGDISSGESEDDIELETETSMTASMQSDSSSVASQDRDQNARLSPATTTTTLAPSTTTTLSPHTVISNSNTKSSPIPRSKQVIFRRFYKRYLVSTPPPVLVIHLKRFQQVGVSSKTGAQFFGNFKKLDDVVNFSEYLDLGPFLMPKREDFGLKSKKSVANKEGNVERVKGDGKCMYRLYAVIVHIGNMLGGHYVAYTALPEGSSQSTSPEEQTRDAMQVQSDSTTIASSATISTSPSPSSSPKSGVESPSHPQTPRTSAFEASADPNPRAKPSHAALAARKWCYISDTTVRLATLEEVLKAKAYICMYEKI